ncbi:hypothetical protein [Nocardioides caricicola]|uniref:Uncharacterized protein n=1 Tax=Nocardioides caricicola TaxID=634770 RepID=A0ABW0N1W3_9ACTN
MSDGLSTIVIGLFTLVATLTVLYLVGNGGLPRRKDPDRDD